MGKLTKLNLLFSLSIVLCACSFNSLLEGFEKDKPRTYYETLDLSTPEEAVMTFTQAFQRDDFMTVYLVLDQRTQYIWVQHIRTLRYGDIFKREYYDEVIEDVPCMSEGLGSGEHSCGEPWYLFDDIMLSAKEHSALLIDLSGKVEILDTEDSETFFGDESVDVIGTVEGIDDDVVFRMVQAPSGRWRVYQVIVVGGDEEIVPWAVPHK